MKIDIDGITCGRATVAEAQETLTALIGGGQNWQIEAACTAMRAWTWKALDGRRHDDSEMRAWHEMVQGYSVYLLDSHPEHSGRLRTLWELVYESISVAEVRRSTDSGMEDKVRRPRPGFISAEEDMLHDMDEIDRRDEGVLTPLKIDSIRRFLKYGRSVADLEYLAENFMVSSDAVKRVIDGTEG